MKAAIYARYSTEHQTENSIETQVNACKEYAQAHGMEVVSIFADEAVSGMKLEREGLQGLLSAAKCNMIDCVIIYDQSRLSRDLINWFTLRNTLNYCGIALYSVLTDQFGDVQDPTNFMMESVQAVFNQMHVLVSRQKTIAGMRNIASKGLFAGGSACLGYDIIDKQYVINEREAQCVRLLFAMYAEGCGYCAIIDELNNRGYRTKAGKTFGKNSLSSILRNERYIGTFTHGRIFKNPDGSRNSHKESSDMIRIENAVPRIISDEVWNMVQKRLANKKMNARNTATTDYLLSGKIFCGKCGGAMCGERRSHDYYYYVCNTRKRLRTCDKKGVRKEYIEEIVLNEIRKLFTVEKIEVVSQNIYNSMAGIQVNIAPIKSDIRKKIAEVTGKIDKINDAISEGVYSSSTVGKLKALEEEQAQLFVQLSAAEKTDVQTQKSYEDIRSCIEGIAKDNLSDKLLIDLCVEKVVCYDDGYIDIIFDPCGFMGAEIRTQRVHDSSHQLCPYYHNGIIYLWMKKDAK